MPRDWLERDERLILACVGHNTSGPTYDLIVSRVGPCANRTTVRKILQSLIRRGILATDGTGSRRRYRRTAAAYTGIL